MRDYVSNRWENCYPDVTFSYLCNYSFCFATGTVTNMSRPFSRIYIIRKVGVRFVSHVKFFSDSISSQINSTIRSQNVTYSTNLSLSSLYTYIRHYKLSLHLFLIYPRFTSCLRKITLFFLNYNRCFG